MFRVQGLFQTLIHKARNMLSIQMQNAWTIVWQTFQCHQTPLYCMCCFKYLAINISTLTDLLSKIFFIVPPPWQFFNKRVVPNLFRFVLLKVFSSTLVYSTVCFGHNLSLSCLCFKHKWFHKTDLQIFTLQTINGSFAQVSTTITCFLFIFLWWWCSSLSNILLLFCPSCIQWYWWVHTLKHKYLLQSLSPAAWIVLASS